MSTLFNQLSPIPEIRRLPIRLDLPDSISSQIPDPTRKQFFKTVVILVANIDTVIDLPGDYFYIEESSQIIVTPDLIAGGKIITARDDNGNVLTLTAANRGYAFPTPFAGITLRSTDAITLSLYIGFGRIENNSGARIVVGLGDTTSSGFLRPGNVTPYAPNQCVSNGLTLLTFARISRYPSCGAVITRARVIKNTPNLVNANFTLFLFSAGTAPAIPADQSAFVLLFGQLQVGQGIINFPAFVSGGAGSDAAVCEISGLALPVKTDSTLTTNSFTDNLSKGGSLVGILVCNAAYVPGNGEQFIVELFTDKY